MLSDSVRHSSFSSYLAFVFFMGLLFDTSNGAFLFCLPRPHESLE